MLSSANVKKKDCKTDIQHKAAVMERATVGWTEN